MTAKIIGIPLAALFGVAGANVAAQTRGLVPTLAPTIYSAPTPAPLAPPINPGPAVVPPAGPSPVLTEPGPVYATPEQAMPAYPSPQLPGPVGQQNMQSNRNNLLDQQWLLERSGVSPGERTQPRNPAAAEPAGIALRPGHSAPNRARSQSAITVHSISGARAAAIMPTCPSGGRSTVAPRSAAASASPELVGTIRSGVRG